MLPQITILCVRLKISKLKSGIEFNYCLAQLLDSRHVLAPADCARHRVGYARHNMEGFG
ncbi:hypothetical protein A2U01_0048181, partial [Trifolium medium]|nr:hypothetical protein [Trifolium medium]